MSRRSLAVLSIAYLMILIADPPVTSAGEIPWVATWHRNMAAAVSLRFDDALEAHATYVVPKLNEYGIKATFMVNPGTGRYMERRAFWESDVPKMGHQLGNHTLHHRGARTVREAEVEIGEVSRLIWRLYPRKSRLLVFASGGGKKWGGRDWKDAGPEYKDLVGKYHLIDLYDGRHPSMGASSRRKVGDLKRAILEAMAEGHHQPFTFHGVGEPGLLDMVKAIYRGYDLTFDRRSFDELLSFLYGKRDRLWIAPLADILRSGMSTRSSRRSPANTRWS